MRSSSSIQTRTSPGNKTADAILRYFRGEQVEKDILIRTNLYRKADAEREN